MSLKFLKSHWHMICALCAIPVIAILLLPAPAPAPVSEQPGRRKTISAAEAAEEIRAMKKYYDTINIELYTQFKQDVASAGEANFQLAEDNIPSTVEYFSRYRACAALLNAMVQDSFRGTSSAKNIILSRLGKKIISPCAAGAADVNGILENFIHRIQENDNLFRAMCAAKASSISAIPGNSGIDENFFSQLDNFSDLSAELAYDTAGVALSVTVDAVFWKQTHGILQRICAGTALRLSGSAAAPFVDGPLPIGDIIAIGGFAWSAWDIIKITRLLPAEMEKILQNCVSDLKSSCRTGALLTGERVLEMSIRSSEKIVSGITVETGKER